MRTDWLQKLDEYWYKIYTPYSCGFDFQTERLLQYCNELTLGEAIESDYLIWRSEKHGLAPKYDILRSLVPLIKQYNVTLEDDDIQFKTTCHHRSGFVTCSGRSG